MKSNPKTPKTDAVAREIGRVLGHYAAQELSLLEATKAIDDQLNHMRNMELGLVETEKLKKALPIAMDALESVHVIRKRVIKTFPEYYHEMNVVSKAISQINQLIYLPSTPICHGRV